LPQMSIGILSKIDENAKNGPKSPYLLLKSCFQ
jgi:hypothetical protein